MEFPVSYYIKMAIVASITLVILMFGGLKLSDYANSKFVTAHFSDNQFVYQKANKYLRANEYEKMVYAEGEEVVMLYNKQRDKMYVYLNFFNYFKSFVVSFVILFIGWGMILNERKNILKGHQAQA